MLLTYIHLSLASLSVLFKHESLSFVNLSLYLYDVLIFWSEHLYILSKLQRPALKVRILWCKAGIYSWNLSEKVSQMYEDSFSIPFLCNLKYISLYFIYNGIKSSCKQPISFRDKFQDTKEISVQTARVSFHFLTHSVNVIYIQLVFFQKFCFLKSQGVIRSTGSYFHVN